MSLSTFFSEDTHPLLNKINAICCGSDECCFGRKEGKEKHDESSGSTSVVSSSEVARGRDLESGTNCNEKRTNITSSTAVLDLESGTNWNKKKTNITSSTAVLQEKAKDVKKILEGPWNWPKPEGPQDATIRVYRGRKYYFCHHSTGGKCSGKWRPHEPSSCPTAKEIDV